MHATKLIELNAYPKTGGGMMEEWGKKSVRRFGR